MSCCPSCWGRDGSLNYRDRSTLTQTSYLTDQYLKSTPRRDWEHIAIMVEDALPGTPRMVARHVPAPDDLTAPTMLVPFGHLNN